MDRPRTLGELKASGWEAPAVFVAKGRDGKTDIWGIIARPRNFDPNKKYPLLVLVLPEKPADPEKL